MRVAIFGGTGTLGQALTKKLLGEGHQVGVFSRCELKQSQMRAEFSQYGRNILFTIGDIRDRDSVFRFLSRSRYDVVFHTAALKHVEILECNPEESVRTNIDGTINVADAALAGDVPYVVFSSTDKAIDPINVYGMSKGIAERILLNRNFQSGATRYSVFRWGNVVASRGSAIPKFISAIRNGEFVKVTDPKMTRYWVTIEQAVDFMLSNFRMASLTEAMVPPMKSATVIAVIDAIGSILGKSYDWEKIGNRGGEKMHESIHSIHSKAPMSSDKSEMYTHQELIDLLRPIVEASL